MDNMKTAASVACWPAGQFHIKRGLSTISGLAATAVAEISSTSRRIMVFVERNRS
jgi:hypothetical protein